VGFEEKSMINANFQPAGATFAAIVAGLAPGAAIVGQAPAPVETQAEAETSARETLADVAARMAPSAPFGAGQLALPFED
jgi:hypothetical protein